MSTETQPPTDSINNDEAQELQTSEQSSNTEVAQAEENTQKPELLKLDYDGSILHDRFAYAFFRDKYVATGNIISFRGKMDVSTNLIDKEDLLNKDYIYSDDAINFCWEIPNIDAFAGVAFQRLFVTHVGNILGNISQQRIIVNGDDLLIPVEGNDGAESEGYKKASVSISTCRNGAVLGHLGINVSAGDKAPTFAYSTNLTDEQLVNFAIAVESLFYKTTRDIFVATTKTVG